VVITLYSQDKDDTYYLHSTKNKIDLDFYLPKRKTAIQVAWELNNFSKEREIRTLLSLAKVDNNVTDFCIVIWQQEETIHQDNVTINVIPLYKFLLAEQRYFFTQISSRSRLFLL
jgi:hypothetical protein